jgi:hypothetical protein
LVSAGLSSRRFAQRHAELSRELLGVPGTDRATPPRRERNSAALAPGSGWPIDQTANPSIILVEYVRVYQPGAKGEARAGSTSGSSAGSLKIIRR